MKWLTRLAAVLLALALGFVLLYLAADAWLESAGGRRALERELVERTGMPVRLEGAFEVMLFPSIGVEGTELVVGSTGAREALLHSREYAVALEAGPLLRGELRVRSVRLASGTLRLDRIPDTGQKASGSTDAPLSLPAIDALTVREFMVVVPGGQIEPIEVAEFGIEGFEAGRDAGFRIDVEAVGRVTGTVRWDPVGASLNLDANAPDLLPDGLSFGATLDYDRSSGRVRVNWPARPASPDDLLAFSGEFSIRDGGARLADLELSAGPQSVHGEGCLLLEGGPSLQLFLSAGELDLDRLPALPPIADESGGDGVIPADLDVAIRLEAGEVRRADAVARKAVLALGDDPDCSRLD